MARKTEAWRGYGLQKETSYGVGGGTFTRLFHSSGPIDVRPNHQETNEDEITGFNSPTRRDILTKIAEFSHEQRAMPHNLALFMSMVMGQIISDQPDNANDPNVYRHYIQRLTNTDKLQSIPVIEFDGIDQRMYPGAVCKSLEMTAEREGFVRINAALMASGAESIDATPAPAVGGESYMKFGDIKINRGGSLSGSVGTQDLSISGETEISAKVRSFKWTVDNGGQAKYHLGDPSGFVGAMERGARWQHTLEAQIEIDDATHHDVLINQTQYVLFVPILGAVIPGGSGSFNYKADIYFPLVEYEEAAKSYDGDGNTIIDTKFVVLEDQTHGDFIAEVHNEVAGYLT